MSEIIELATMSEKKHVYFENLDALRFLSFLAVFFYHSFSTEFAHVTSSPVYQFIKKGVFGNGNLGVNFFFVLSGFLITYLLIAERKKQGKIHVRRFWMRRVLRIWPLFYGCVAFGFLVFPLLKSLFGEVPNETANPLLYLFFLNNFDLLWNGLPDASILGVLWSIAIEEQFYLVWPLILALLPIRKYWVAFLIIILVSWGFRWFNPSYNMHELHTLSCIGDMAIGALGAWLIATSSRFRRRVEEAAKWHVVILYMAVGLVFFFRSELLLRSPVIAVFERSIIALLFLGVIFDQTYVRKRLFQLGRSALLTNLGKISYGLYCLHFVGILVVTTLTKKAALNTAVWQVLVLESFASLLVTIVLAKLSFRLLERPFLKLKDRFSAI